MAKFHYAAIRPDGKPINGVLKAGDRRRADRILRRRRLRNIRLTEKRSLLQFEITSSKVKRDDIMHLSRQLAAFVQAGLPLIEAVHVLGDESKSKGLQRVLSDVEEGLHRGETFWECLDRHPDVFPAFYRGILRSAEITGRLHSVLEQLANYLERDVEVRRKTRAAMIYPFMIIGLSLVTVVILAAFVLPRFEVFFTSLGANLPWPTRVLLAITEFTTNWWWAMLAGAAAIAVLYVLAVRTHGGRRLRDRIYLRLPVIGDAIRIALVERFCRVLGSMAGSGVSLPEALRVATESLGNLVFVSALSRVGESMLEGEGLANPLSETGLFPVTAARMIRVGEDTGTLDVQLEFTARYYESELDYKIKNLVALIEPTVILAMGLMVGFVAIALVSAMYGIFNQVQV